MLKTGLVLLDKGDIRFHVDNFDRTTMAELDKRWDEIDRVLRSAAKLLADFGFSTPTLTANSVLIPIAYYLHRRGVPDNYLTSPAYAADRDAIKRWVQRALIKPAYGFRLGSITDGTARCDRQGRSVGLAGREH